jgi:hypothetical protein
MALSHLLMILAANAVAANAVAANAVAQPPASMITLSVPPTSAGTCMPARPVKSDSTSGPLRGALLVMVSRESAGRREIAAYVDAKGILRRYTETASIGTGPTARASESVIAGLSARGEWNGILMKITVSMQPLSPTEMVDTAKLRAMRDGAKSTQSSAALTPAQLQQARAVGAAIVARCGAK